MGIFLFSLFVISFLLLVREVYYKKLQNINMLSTINSMLFTVMALYFILQTTTSLIVSFFALLPMWLIYRVFKMPMVLTCVSYLSKRKS